MTIQSRLDSLAEKHAFIERKIQESFLHHAHDQTIAKLKKQRLQLREEIEYYTSLLHDEREVA